MRTGDASLNKVLELQRNNDIIALLLDGRSTSDIVQYICDKYEIATSTAENNIAACRSEIKERKNFEVRNMLLLHLARYEYIYEDLMSLNMYSMATSCLKAKEKLMGFHREGFHMRVSSGNVSQVQVKHVQNEYDLNVLSVEKRDRLTELLEKGKRQ